MGLYLVSPETASSQPMPCVPCRCCPGGMSRSTRGRCYPSDMTDAEWAVIEPLLPVPGWLAGRGGSPGTYCRRDIVDAIRYLVHNGCVWRALAAAVQDRDAAKTLLWKLAAGFRQVSLIWADGGYAGKLVSWMASTLHRTLQIIKRPENLHTFKVLPRRWVVERTFGWIMKYRRCVRDYELPRRRGGGGAGPAVGG
jgi:transposase